MYVDKFWLFLWLKAGTSDCCCPGCWRREFSKAVWYRYFFWWFGEHRRILLTVFSKVVGRSLLWVIFVVVVRIFFSFWKFVCPPPVSILVAFVWRVQTDFDVVFRFRCLYSLFVLTSPDWFCRVLILTLSSASGVYIRYLFSTNPDWLDCFSASGVSTRSFRWTSPDFLMI